MNEKKPARRAEDKRADGAVDWTDAPRFTALGIAETWTVTVEAEGQMVLSIGDDHVASLDSEALEQFAPTIRSCAQHLLGFIGAAPGMSTTDAAKGAIARLEGLQRYYPSSRGVMTPSFAGGYIKFDDARSLHATTAGEQAEPNSPEFDGISAVPAAPEQVQAEPAGYVLMPKRLTAENGAKGALFGEIKESIEVPCPECHDEGDDYECATCENFGRVTQDVPVSWDTIKRIYEAAVDLLAAPGAAAPAQIQEGCAIDSKGTTYHNIAEIYHQAELLESLHMWLDDHGVSRAHADGDVYSPVGRVTCLLKLKRVLPADVEQKVQAALTLAMAICDAVPSHLHATSEDGPLRHVGRLANYQEESGAHGYAAIRDAKELFEKAGLVGEAPAAPEQDEVRNQAPGSESATDWAMKHACRDLPDNYEVSIELENGYGGVLWRERGGDWHAVEGDGDLSDQINEAVERAIEAFAMKTATNEGDAA